jgi:hypothetical protein
MTRNLFYLCRVSNFILLAARLPFIRLPVVRISMASTSVLSSPTNSNHSTTFGTVAISIAYHSDPWTEYPCSFRGPRLRTLDPYFPSQPNKLRPYHVVPLTHFCAWLALMFLCDQVSAALHLRRLPLPPLIISLAQVVGRT